MEGNDKAGELARSGVAEKVVLISCLSPLSVFKNTSDVQLETETDGDRLRQRVSQNYFGVYLKEREN